MEKWSHQTLGPGIENQPSYKGKGEEPHQKEN